MSLQPPSDTGSPGSADLRTRVRIHSDSPFFSGSENLIGLLIADADLGAEFDISLEYRAHAAYEAGMNRRLPPTAKTIPLGLPEIAAWAARFPSALRPLAKALAHATGLKYRFLRRDLGMLRTEMAASGPEIVHIQDGGYPGAYSCLAAAVAAHESGARTVFMVNNLARGYDGPMRWFDRSWDRRAVGSVDLWVTGSSAAAARLAEVLELAPGAVRVVPNGVDLRLPRLGRDEALSRIGVDPSRLVVAQIANLERRKGHEHLLRAIVIMRDRGASIPVFVLEGDGPDRGRIASMVGRLGLERDVVMPGRLEHVPDLMEAADVLVLPSVTDEDFPNVVLEAMGYGKPVVASRIAGVPEQVADGETGILVEPGDAEGIAEALGRLANDAVLRGRLGSAARARYERDFTPRAAAKRWADVYRDLKSSRR